MSTGTVPRLAVRQVEAVVIGLAWFVAMLAMSLFILALSGGWSPW